MSKLMIALFVTAGLGFAGEPPRDSRRLHYLRGWSHEQSDEVCAGGPRAGSSAGL